MKAQEFAVRVRIPPSPTGDPHLGTAYMAVFNYLFALKEKGQVVLRFEDTDFERNVKGSEEAILESLEWLGIRWDEGPYRQSQRLEIYRQYAQELIRRGMAYQKEGAIFLKVDQEGVVVFDDLIRGRVTTPKKEIKDQVLIKSDGVATYNFAVVIDDAFIDRITHVIRGEGHISNTPKQVLVYEALGKRVPQFAHFPHLKGEGGKKLSKRHGAGSVLEMRSRGFLPEALVNYLILLGWTHPQGKEVFTLEEAARFFDLSRMHKGSPTFDLEKLTWLNGQWINRLEVEDLEARIKDFYAEEDWDEETLGRVVPLVRERMRTLREFRELTDYFFQEKVRVPKMELEKYGKPSLRNNFLREVFRKLGGLTKEEWQEKTLEKILRSLQEKSGLSTKEAFMSLRLVLTGKTATPGLFEVLEVLGKEKTLRRIGAFLGNEKG